MENEPSASREAFEDLALDLGLSIEAHPWEPLKWPRGWDNAYRDVTTRTAYTVWKDATSNAPIAEDMRQLRDALCEILEGQRQGSVLVIQQLEKINADLVETLEYISGSLQQAEDETLVAIRHCCDNTIRRYHGKKEK
jgi:hypothetical protein